MMRFKDSFDGYQTAHIEQRYTTVLFGPTIAAASGSCGSQAMQFGVFAQVTKGIAFGSLTGGFGHRLNITLQGAGTQLILGGLGHANGRHVYYARNYDGSLSVYRNDAASGFSSTLLGSTAADVIRVNDVYYVEFKSAIHDTTGTVHMHVNGVEVLALTNQDTKGASTALTSWWMGNENGNGSCSFMIDDLMIWDSVAGEVDDFPGPVRVEALFVDAAGNYVGDFTTVGAASEHQAVRDVSGPDGDTSYIQSATVGHQNSNNLQGTGLPAGTIKSVQVNLNARVTDAGFRGIKPLLRSGGNDYLGTQQFPGQSYRYLHEVFETDPDTAAAWDIAGVNALELGVEVTT